MKSLNLLCTNCLEWSSNHATANKRYKCLWHYTYFRAAKCTKCQQPIRRNSGDYLTLIQINRTSQAVAHSSCWTFSNPYEPYAWEAFYL